jgi:hypothetical protein
VGGVTVVDGGGGIGDSWHQGGELTREEEKDVIWRREEWDLGEKGRRQNTADRKHPDVILS